MLQAELKVLGGKFQGKAIPLNTRRFLVGREQDCHLRPNSDSVSRHHCVFVIDDYTVRLRDLGSTNGTRVNGELIRHETVLKDGDQIHIGKLHLELNVREGAAVESIPAVANAPEVAKGATPASEFEVPVSQSTSETMFEIPAMPQIPAAADTTTNFAADTTILGAGGPPSMVPYAAPPMGYPMGMPPQPMPGYGMPPAYPGYPPGYPAGYAMPPMPGYPPAYGMPGYPAMPNYAPAPGAVGAAEVPEPVDKAAATAAAAAAIPTKLPPPESTGVREAAAPPKPADGEAPPAAAKTEEKPSASAADIIKQYMQRRTTR
ncbi:MAG: hypothetical protein B7Z55_01805 [Planctomycetales bacterium 12-60-4]|nr:MAG: hypothetical protein B7Z55_01805 [Planctomycetales bacterium 12-60-4]